MKGDSDEDFRPKGFVLYFLNSRYAVSFFRNGSRHGVDVLRYFKLTHENIPVITEWTLLNTKIVSDLIVSNPGSYIWVDQEERCGLKSADEILELEVGAL